VRGGLKRLPLDRHSVLGPWSIGDLLVCSEHECAQHIHRDSVHPLLVYCAPRTTHRTSPPGTNPGPRSLLLRRYCRSSTREVMSSRYGASSFPAHRFAAES
jgi:hypothetical protein